MYRSETQTALNKNILYFIRWTAISIVMGTVCGLIGTAFGYGVIYAQRLFKTHSFMLYLMPVVGVLIVLPNTPNDAIRRFHLHSPNVLKLTFVFAFPYSSGV